MWTRLLSRSRKLAPFHLRLPQTWSRWWYLAATRIGTRLLPSLKSSAESQVLASSESSWLLWHDQTGSVDEVHCKEW